MANGPRFGTFSIPANTPGDVVVTGVGFKPSELQILGAAEAALDSGDESNSRQGHASSAEVDSESSSDVMTTAGTQGQGGSANLIDFNIGGLQQVLGTLKSFDDDGFTVDVSANNSGADLLFTYAASNNA